jgi:hypothetical protein
MWLRRFRSWLARSSRSAAATRRLGSLRDAILLADFHQDAPGEVDRIVFNLAGAGPGRRSATLSPRGCPTRPRAESTDHFARFLAFRPRVPGKVYSPCTGVSAVRPPAAPTGY